MDLNITAKESQGIAVLSLTGRIVLGDECDGLRAQLTQLLAAGTKKILLNMDEVKRVDSSGIGILVEAVVLTSKGGGRLKLCNVPRLLQNTLVLHRLLAAFEIYENEADALASFS